MLTQVDVTECMLTQLDVGECIPTQLDVSECVLTQVCMLNKIDVVSVSLPN